MAELSKRQSNIRKMIDDNTQEFFCEKEPKEAESSDKILN